MPISDHPCFDHQTAAAVATALRLSAGRYGHAPISDEISSTLASYFDDTHAYSISCHACHACQQARCMRQPISPMPLATHYTSQRYNAEELNDLLVDTDNCPHSSLRLAYLCQFAEALEYRTGLTPGVRNTINRVNQRTLICEPETAEDREEFGPVWITIHAVAEGSTATADPAHEELLLAMAARGELTAAAVFAPLPARA